MRKPLISFCTVVKNRLHHLQKTLPVNMAENPEDFIEFVVLDYNSCDGLEQYIKDTFPEDLKSGRLVFYRYNHAAHFVQSHSRNMAFTLAKGDIVCNLDADNYAGVGYGRYIKTMFESKPGIFLTAIENKKNVRDVKGKICVRKTEFENATGYDESFTGYGYEDHDLVNRLQMNGLIKHVIHDETFLKAISHEDEERMSNEKITAELDSLFVRYIDADRSEILLLRKDRSFHVGVVNDNHSAYTKKTTDETENPRNIFRYSMTYPGWEAGAWTLSGDHLILQANQQTRTFSRINNGQFLTLLNNAHRFYQVTDEALIREGLLFYMQVTNRMKMLDNLIHKRVKVNIEWGKEAVC